MPTASAHTPAWSIPTYAYISASPDPVGVGGLRGLENKQNGLARVTVDSVKAEATKTYRAHLDTLRLKTAEVLATYGPTLTELKDDDWVGIYFDVGSAAALLGGGMDNYLVQARMRDIRQAATQSDPAAWLRGRLVTNEKED